MEFVLNIVDQMDFVAVTSGTTKDVQKQCKLYLQNITPVSLLHVSSTYYHSDGCAVFDQIKQTSSDKKVKLFNPCKF